MTLWLVVKDEAQGRRVREILQDLFKEKIEVKGTVCQHDAVLLPVAGAKEEIAKIKSLTGLKSVVS